MNRESEILQKKYISESNTVNNMKLMILEKIRVIRTFMFPKHYFKWIQFLCGKRNNEDDVIHTFSKMGLNQTIWSSDSRQLAVAGRSLDVVEPNPIQGRLLVLV